MKCLQGSSSKHRATGQPTELSDAVHGEPLAPWRGMQLVQIVVPVFDSAGGRHPRDRFDRTLAELTDRFGGATAFTRAPAEGLWEDGSGRVVRDDVIVVEVMAEEGEDAWWAEYKRRLELRFEQESILIRTLPCRVL